MTTPRLNSLARLVPAPRAILFGGFTVADRTLGKLLCDTWGGSGRQATSRGATVGRGVDRFFMRRSAANPDRHDKRRRDSAIGRAAESGPRKRLRRDLVPTASVAGVALDSEGRPMSGGVASSIREIGVNAAGPVASDGSFTLTNLVPGPYSIVASSRAREGELQDIARATVIVNGEDIVGLRLMAQKQATVHGHLVLDTLDRTRASSLRAEAIRLEALAAIPEEAVVMGASSATTFEDWSFEVKTHPGPTLIRLRTSPGGWQLEAVRLNGLDVTDRGFDLRSGESVDGLEVVLTDRLSQVSGRVVDAKRQPVGDYSVAIVAADRAQWNFLSRYLAYCRPDQDGRFKATGLPPGEYLAIALDYIEPGAQTDPDFLERIQSRVTRFSLARGEAKTLDLQLQSSP